MLCILVLQTLVMKNLLTLLGLLLAGFSVGAQATSVVINELMASNQTTVADQDGEFDDWIELYNTSANAVDLTGHFLTDNNENLTKYDIPDGTTIGGNDYLIVWADEDGMQAGLHANFRLSRDGEAVYLIDPDLEVIDMVTFGPQETDVAYARQPNGTGDFVMKEATFDDNNDLTSSTEDEAPRTILIFPNPVRDQLYIQGDLDGAELVQVFKVTGQLTYQTLLRGGQAIDASEWESGFYLLRVGERVGKVVVR